MEHFITGLSATHAQTVHYSNTHTNSASQQQAISMGSEETRYNNGNNER